MTEQLLSLENIKQIPQAHYPLMVFCDNPCSFFSWGVKARTKGVYGHFMWLFGPNQLASQGLWLQEKTVEAYTGYTMKFVWNPNWTSIERALIISAIKQDLALPWYKTLYDVPGIFGKAIGLSFINIPWLSYCSERGRYLGLIDPGYTIKHPSPSQLNQWTKERPDRYSVYGRYATE